MTHCFVHDFFEAAKDTRDRFVSRYAHPFLVWLGRQAVFDDTPEDEADFYTTLISKSAVHDRMAIDLGSLLNPNHAVFPLVKRRRAWPRTKSQSAVIIRSFSWFSEISPSFMVMSLISPSFSKLPASVRASAETPMMMKK